MYIYIYIYIYIYMYAHVCVYVYKLSELPSRACSQSSFCCRIAGRGLAAIVAPANINIIIIIVVITIIVSMIVMRIITK